MGIVTSSSQHPATVDPEMSMLRSADQMIEIRDLRNQIAHEYIPEAIRDLIPEVIELTSQLIENIEDCRHFMETREWIKNKETPS